MGRWSQGPATLGIPPQMPGCGFLQVTPVVQAVGCGHCRATQTSIVALARMSVGVAPATLTHKGRRMFHVEREDCDRTARASTRACYPRLKCSVVVITSYRSRARRSVTVCGDEQPDLRHTSLRAWVTLQPRRRRFHIVNLWMNLGTSRRFERSHR